MASSAEQDNIQGKIYINLFEEILRKALDCCDSINEEVLIEVCLLGMLKEYYIFLKNLAFSSFFKLMEATSHTNYVIRRTKRSSSATQTSLASITRKVRRKGLVVVGL